MDTDQLLKRIRDYPWFAANLLKVKSKLTSEMVPLVPTPAQSLFRSSHRSKSIVLKARQQGMSTDILGRFFWKTITLPNQTTVVISHTAQATENLLMKVRLYYENLPDVFRPEVEYRTKNRFYWPKLNSSFYIGTAGGVGVGRGDTINNLHCSELPEWEGDPKETFLAALAAVPPTGEVVIESTAKGIGNYYHAMWRDAERGKGMFNPIFLPWMMDPAYRYDVRPGEDLDEFYKAPKEWEDYEKEFKLSEEQKKWHRIMRQQYGEVFDQEYPASAELAFIASSRCYFSSAAIKGYRKMVEEAKPKVVGSLKRNIDKVEVVPDKHGAVTIWKEPNPETHYVIFADVAEGLEHGDYSCAYVYDVWDRDYVAEWHGRVDPDLFADELDMLGRLYAGIDGRLALVGVERNNHGYATLVRLKRDLHYPRIYYRKRFDKRVKEETESLGWLTDVTTKRWMLDLFAGHLRDGVVGVFSAALLNECETFMRAENPNRVGGAEPPNNDDRVMAAAGCLVISVDIPPKPVSVAEAPWKKPTAEEFLNWKWRIREEEEKEEAHRLGRKLW